jgi:hypothetical protein
MGIFGDIMKIYHLATLTELCIAQWAKTLTSALKKSRASSDLVTCEAWAKGGKSVEFNPTSSNSAFLSFRARSVPPFSPDNY